MAEVWDRLLEELSAPLDENGRRIPSPSSPAAVVSWPAPRGGRDEDGSWKWSLASRPADSFVSDLEQRSVDAYRGIASTLVGARNSLGRTLRQVSSDTGVALSVITGVEQGGAWPRFDTLATLAAALGCRVQVAGDRVRTVGEDRVDQEMLVRSWLDAGYQVGGPWQILAVDELSHRMRAAGQSKTAVARAVRLRHNTVTELYHVGSVTRYASVRTLSALAAHLGTGLEIVPAGAAWS